MKSRFTVTHFRGLLFWEILGRGDWQGTAKRLWVAVRSDGALSLRPHHHRPVRTVSETHRAIRLEMANCCDVFGAPA